MNQNLTENLTEKFNESVKNFTELQNQMINGFFFPGVNASTVKNPFENLPNANEIYDNTVKFHNACIQYHTSILTAMEALNSLNPVTNKKNKK
jgi:hypothetical protein